MPNYLISWNTWFEGEQECPWPWMPVNRIKEYRHRDDDSKVLNEDAANDIYLSFNPQRIMEFERDYRDGLVLAAMITADDELSAKFEITSRFPDSELNACLVISESLYPAVMLRFEKKGHWWKANAL